MPEIYISQANFAVDAIIDGRDFGRFKSMSAPELVAEAFKVRPPGGAEQARPNPIRSREDAELQRKASLSDVGSAHWLDPRVGLAPAQLVYRALNPDQTPYGTPLAFTGYFISYALPETDSDEGSGEAMFIVRFALDELAG